MTTDIIVLTAMVTILTTSSTTLLVLVLPLMNWTFPSESLVFPVKYLYKENKKMEEDVYFTAELQVTVVNGGFHKHSIN